MYRKKLKKMRSKKLEDPLFPFYFGNIQKLRRSKHSRKVEG